MTGAAVAAEDRKMFGLVAWSWSPLAELKNSMTTIFYFPGIPHFQIHPDLPSLNTLHPLPNQQLKNLKKVIARFSEKLKLRHTLNFEET